MVDLSTRELYNLARTMFGSVARESEVLRNAFDLVDRLGLSPAMVIDGAPHEDVVGEWLALPLIAQPRRKAGK